MSKPIALQVWTVRDDLAADFKGTYKKIAEIGYKGVEIGMDAGGMSFPEFGKFLNDLGLQATSAHVGVDVLSGDLAQAVDFAQAMGIKWIVCPWMNSDTAQGWIDLAKILDEAGRKLREAGLGLAYHNHAHEFTKFDGEYVLDLIYKTASADALKAQIDTYWVKKGGEDPVKYIRKYSGRIPFIHCKDMDEGGDFAEVGEGILDFPAILKAADEAGAEYYIVEQDVCKRPPLESIKISFDNLSRMLG